jgi:AraC family transcriptional regulator, arabinose operon regulatory protein
MNIEKYQNLVPEVLYFVDRLCFPEWEIVKQRITFHDLTFVMDGKSDYYVDGVKYTVEARDMIYIPDGSVREANTHKDFPMRYYAFNFYWLYPSNDIHLPFSTVTKISLSSEMLDFIKKFAQVWMCKQPGYKMHARGLLHLIIHRLLTICYHKTSYNHRGSRVDKLMEYIIEHYSEDIDLKKLSAIVNLHPVYLGELFKKNVNYTVKEYLNLITINNA